MANKMNLQIITPKKIVLEREIDSLVAPTKAGEVTILPNHMPLFSVLDDGVIEIKHDKEETYLSIGGGYLETDGKTVHLLVSRAAGQDEIDEKEVLEAKQEAEKRVKEAPTDEARHAATLQLRRSLIDIKLLQKARRRKI